LCFSEVLLEAPGGGENETDDDGSRSKTAGRTGGETVDLVGILIDIGISNFGGEGIGCRCCVRDCDGAVNGDVVVPRKDNALNFRDGELKGDNDDSPICCFRGDIPFSAPSNVLAPKPTVVAVVAVVAVVVVVVRLVTNCSIDPTVIPPFPFAFPTALIFLGLFFASTWSSNLATHLGIVCRT